MSWAIPVKRLRETDTLLAFYHPQPSYPTHIVIVPRRAISGMADVSVAHGDFLLDLFATVRSLVEELDLDTKGYRLICNGGAYQDVRQLHFHLVSGK